MDKIKKNYIAYGKLLNKCWDDPDYLAKFREDPATCLEEFGIRAIPGAKYHIVAPEEMKPSTKEDVYLYYMPKPEVVNLDDDVLKNIAAGKVIPGPPVDPMTNQQYETETETQVEVETQSYVYEHYNLVTEVDAIIFAGVVLAIIGQGDETHK